MPASHFDVNSMTGRPKFIVRHSTLVLKFWNLGKILLLAYSAALMILPV
jgi:hypothetical protein